jgi:hypothetical protein
MDVKCVATWRTSDHRVTRAEGIKAEAAVDTAEEVTVVETVEEVDMEVIVEEEEVVMATETVEVIVEAAVMAETAVAEEVGDTNRCAPSMQVYIPVL